MAGGTLILNYTATSPGIILNSSNNLTFTNTSEFQFQAGSGTSASMTLSTLTFSGGEGKVNSAPQQAVDPATLTFSSLAARAAGATGNFVQFSLPKAANALASSGSTITLSIADAVAVNSFYLGESVTGTNIPAGRTVTSVDTGTGVVTLSGPTTAVAGQGITFGLQNRRIILEVLLSPS